MVWLFLYIVFGISAAALLHSYIFYPILLRQLAKHTRTNRTTYSSTDQLPIISVLMAVYNEEKVIRQKMESLIHSDYPKENIHIYIGSDNSNDATNSILSEYESKLHNLHFFPYNNRNGKPEIINKLSLECFKNTPQQSDHILLLTDASVILEKNTIQNLVQYFIDPNISIVDSNMLHVGMQQEGISKSENQYISSEVYLKHWEGQVWGKMMGPFGGCYALRSTYFTPVPPNFLVDDFYIAMNALEQDTLAINSLEAVCYESVSHEMAEEYRRKSRISAGNFQNLHTFRHVLNLTTPIGFAFFSHKVLRWLGPIFILLMLTSSLILGLNGNYFFMLLFYCQIFGLFGIPLLDFILKSLNIHVLLLRNISYFNYMNLALLHGFFNYIKGIQSNVWEPPKRNHHGDTT